MDLDALLGLFFFVVFIVLPMISGARKRGKGQPGQQQPGPQQPGQGTRPQQAGQGSAQQRTSTPTPARGASPSGLPPGGATAGTGRDDHPATATLDEIRRRVQDAQERERRREAEKPYARDGGRGATASTQRPARGLVSSDPFERGLVSGTGTTISGEPSSVRRTGVPTAIPGRQQPVGSQGLGREGASTGRAGSLGREGGMPTVQGRGGRSSGSLGREGYAAPSMSTGAPGRRSPLGREGVASRSERAAAAEIGSSGKRPAMPVAGARLGRAGLIRADREGILHGLIWHEILSEAPSKKRLRRTRSRPQ